MISFPISATETRVLSCASCQGKNRILISQIFQNPGQLRCGHCQKNLLCSKEQALLGLTGNEYQHPLDQKSLKALEAIPGISTLLKKLVEVTMERYYRLFHQSSYIRVSSRQFPSLQKVFEKSVYSLGLQTLPELYVYQAPEINAYTGGVEKPYIALSSSLCEFMDDAEIGAVLAHEIAHFQSKHVLYKTAARLFTFAASEVAKYTLGISNLVLVPLQMALLKWDRCSELTADRGMLLSTKDPILSLRVLAKLACISTKLYKELSLEQFMEQAFMARQAPEEGVLDRVYTLLQTISRTHPFPLWRAAELWTWACGDEYVNLLQKYR